MLNGKLIAGLDKDIRHLLKYPSNDGIDATIRILKSMIRSIDLKGKSQKPLKCDEAILPFCTNAIKILKDGTTIVQNIEKSSGNSLFDRSALKALAKASPLPPPPYEMEIGVRFYP